jgi:hypothetical protein
VQPARLGHGGSSLSALGWELQAPTYACGCYSAKHLGAMLLHPPLGEESRPHPYLRAGLRIPHSLMLSMARFRLSSHNLGWNLAGIKEWCGLRVAASDVQLWKCTIFQ